MKINDNYVPGENLNKYFFYFRQDFMKGFNSAFDLYGLSSNFKSIDFGENIDFLSIKSDWDITGNDINNAINNYSASVNK
ncbi:MAG: hypothetical protein V1833_04540 [Elusimicrobiota bacterium]